MITDGSKQETVLDGEMLNIVKNMFDMESMKNCMSENCIDLEKLPLGLLTMDKIKRCHNIL